MADGLYDLIIERDLMVEMRDGVRLATDLYLPARDGQPLPGKFPTVFHRTPYDKSDVERNGNYGRFFARRGYVAVYQDCRGTFQSEGDVNFLLPEAEDGYDALQWIDQQPWSNGKVGSWGTSWSGWTQTAMAALGPTNLKAMVVNMSGADAHESSVRHGGALELRFLAWAFWHSAANTQRALKADPAVDAALNIGCASLCRLAHADAASQGTDPAQIGAALPAVGTRPADQGRLRRVLAAPELRTGTLLGRLPRRANSDYRGLVRFVHALDVQKLRGIRRRTSRGQCGCSWGRGRMGRKP